MKKRTLITPARMTTSHAATKSAIVAPKVHSVKPHPVEAAKQRATKMTTVAQVASEPRTRYYVSFSIHGSSAFAVAYGDFTVAEIDKIMSKEDFKITRSRAPNPSGIKLHWGKLINQKTGEPYKSAPHVRRRFAELEKMGFTLDMTAFDRVWGSKAS